MGAWTGTLSGSQVKLNGSSVSGGAQTITFTSVTNPSASNASFYARIYTFANNSYGTYSNAASPGNYQDYGGIALSTGYTININTNVQEQLIFCVSAAAPGSNCGSGITTPNLSLGSGTPPVVGTAAVSSVNAYCQITTNAVSGVVLRMKGNTPANDYTLYNASHKFAAANSGAATNPGSAEPAGTEMFGVVLLNGTGYTPTAPYAANTAGYYALDTTTSTNNVTAGAGSKLADVATTVSGTSTGTPMTLTFGATAQTGLTTAGNYQANENLMATGTY
jgi:hypothetical protein